MAERTKDEKEEEKRKTIAVQIGGAAAEHTGENRENDSVLSTKQQGDKRRLLEGGKKERE